MARSSRTFILKLSSSGVELFLDCHHRLCQQTNELLPYGQTLYCALIHLTGVESVRILDDLLTLKFSGHTGKRSCFVGAPSKLADMATSLATRIALDVPSNRQAIMTVRLFVVALKRFRVAAPDEVLACYGAMIEDAGELIKLPRRLRSAEGYEREQGSEKIG